MPAFAGMTTGGRRDLNNFGNTAGPGMTAEAARGQLNHYAVMPANAGIHDLLSWRRACDEFRMPGGWIYIMANRPNGTLYIGVTNNLARRIWEHRSGAADGFAKRYGLKRLVYAEPCADIATAIRREKVLKNWSRGQKVRLIQVGNPQWDDLFDRIV